MVVVGGLGTVRGPIIGTFLVMILSELLRDAGMWRLVVLGALLLAVLAFVPAGVDGLLTRGLGRMRSWMNVEGAGGAAAGIEVAAGAPPATGGKPGDGADAETAVAGATSPSGGRAGAIGDTPAAAVAASPAEVTASEAPPVKKSGFKAWLDADQPQAERAQKQAKASKPPKQKREKPGGFKAWLNADQPRQDDTKE
jgi:hypothetical protein